MALQNIRSSNPHLPDSERGECKYGFGTPHSSIKLLGWSRDVCKKGVWVGKTLARGFYVTLFVDLLAAALKTTPVIFGHASSLEPGWSQTGRSLEAVPENVEVNQLPEKLNPTFCFHPRTPQLQCWGEFNPGLGI